MRIARRCARVLVLTVSFWAGTAMASDGEKWMILGRTGTPQREVVSVLRELPSESTRSRFPVLLEFAWGYKSLPDGMPTEEELVLARRLYAALDEIVGAHGMHAMTRTGDGGRTMYYYVENAERYADSIKSFFDALPPITVKVSARAEPGWESVRRVLDPVK